MSLVEQITQIRDLATQGLTESQIAAAVGVEIGDVATVLATTSMAGLTGGGSAGSPVVRKFPFAYNTPNLLTGAALYTPTIGDLLLDAWIVIKTAWNGTTPLCDVGGFVRADSGWFGDQGIGGDPIPMSAADSVGPAFDLGLLVQGITTDPRAPSSLSLAILVNDVIHAVASNNLNTHTNRLLPATFSTAAPVKVVVSQDGHTTGADPGATQGAADLYLMTATPA